MIIILIGLIYATLISTGIILGFSDNPITSPITTAGYIILIVTIISLLFVVGGRSNSIIDFFVDIGKMANYRKTKELFEVASIANDTRGYKRASSFSLNINFGYKYSLRKLAIAILADEATEETITLLRDIVEKDRSKKIIHYTSRCLEIAARKLHYGNNYKLLQALNDGQLPTIKEKYTGISTYSLWKKNYGWKYGLVLGLLTLFLPPFGITFMIILLPKLRIVKDLKNRVREDELIRLVQGDSKIKRAAAISALGDIGTERSLSLLKEEYTNAPQNQKPLILEAHNLIANRLRLEPMKRELTPEEKMVLAHLEKNSSEQ